MNIPDIEKLRGHYCNSTEDDDGYFETNELGCCVQYDDAKKLHEASLFWKNSYDEKSKKLDYVLDNLPSIKYDQKTRDEALRLSGLLNTSEQLVNTLSRDIVFLTAENDKLKQEIEKLKNLLR